MRPHSAKTARRAALKPRKPKKPGRNGQPSRTKDRNQSPRADVKPKTEGSSRCPHEATEDTGSRRVIAKASRVFNAAQVDGYVPPEVTLSTDQITPIEAADRLIRATGARVTESGDRAFYSVTHDQITMPDRVRFTGTTSLSPTEGYYAVLLHELTHWSGAKHRLDRGFGARFGEDAYAMEALVAELGAAFLCADLHITPEPRPDHAAYIDHWLRILKSDRKAIFAAASAASRAAEYLSAFTQDIQVAA